MVIATGFIHRHYATEERERITEQKHLYCFSSLWKTEYGSWRWRGKSVDIISVKIPDEDEWTSFLCGVCTFIPESKTLCTRLNWEGQVDKLEDRAVCHSVDLQQREELCWQKTWRYMQSHVIIHNNIGWMLTGYHTVFQRRTWRCWCMRLVIWVSRVRHREG